MGSSRPATGCTVVNTDSGLGCTSKGKTIAKKLFSLAVVFFVYLCHYEDGFSSVLAESPSGRNGRRSNLEFTLEI